MGSSHAGQCDCIIRSIWNRVNDHFFPTVNFKVGHFPDLFKSSPYHLIALTFKICRKTWQNHLEELRVPWNQVPATHVYLKSDNSALCCGSQCQVTYHWPLPTPMQCLLGVALFELNCSLQNNCDLWKAYVPWLLTFLEFGICGISTDIQILALCCYFPICENGLQVVLFGNGQRVYLLVRPICPESLSSQMWFARRPGTPWIVSTTSLTFKWFSFCFKLSEWKPRTSLLGRKIKQVFSTPGAIPFPLWVQMNWEGLLMQD